MSEYYKGFLMKYGSTLYEQVYEEGCTVVPYMYKWAWPLLACQKSTEKMLSESIFSKMSMRKRKEVEIRLHDTFHVSLSNGKLRRHLPSDMLFSSSHAPKVQVVRTTVDKKEDPFVF